MLRFPLGTGTSGFFARSALGAASIVRPRHARMNAVEIRLGPRGMAILCRCAFWCRIDLVGLQGEIIDDDNQGDIEREMA